MTLPWSRPRFEILIDARENKKQCTIHPLREREDFHIRYFDRSQRPLVPFGTEVLLHVDGVDLTEDLERFGPARSIGLIDCTWKWVAPTMRRLGPSPARLVRIPPDFLTAYPRKSRYPGVDPTGGLATIEAVFIAAVISGTWDETLLAKYHFKNEFLQVNSHLWQKLKFRKVGD